MGLTEPELAQRARWGDLQAFGELVRSHQASVFNVCYRLMGERGEAEDLAQEAFLRAYQRLHLYDPGRPFGPWVRRIAANLCFNHLQAGRLARLPFDDELERVETAGLPSPEISYEHRESAQAIWQAIHALPAHYRAVIELRHFQQMSYEEISNELDITPGMVKTHLFRARKLLAERLAPYER